VPERRPEADLAYRPDIDGLRAVAVVFVVIFHYLPRVVPGGFVGVDVFFVISGFLISGIILRGLEKGDFGYREFYARRIRRIFPALLALFAAYLAAGWFVLTPSEFAQAGMDIAAATGFASNFLLWSQSGYFDYAAQTKPFLHLWSLAIEEQFYVVWPLMIWWLRRRPWAVALFAVMSFATNAALIDSRPAAAFYSPVARFWELLLGGLLAQLTLSVEWTGLTGAAQRLLRSVASAPRARDGVSVAGLVLIGAAGLGLDAESPFPGWRALAPVIGAASLIAAGPAALINRVLLTRRWMVLIGLISYPLYLWHWPLLVLLRQADLDALPAGSRWVRVSAMLLSFALAYLTYRHLEQRVRRASRVVLPLCGLMVLALGVSLAILASKGARSRWSDAQNAVEDQAEHSRLTTDGEWRLNRCFLPRVGPTTFETFCGGSWLGTRPSVVLWGDSHAAQLYPGLLALLPAQGLNLAQFTAALCPPLSDYLLKEAPNCAAINRGVFNWIRRHRPRSVILAASWSTINGYERVEATSARLRSLGVEEVVIVGPVPRFPKPQPVVLIRRAHGGRLPSRVPTSLLPALQSTDAALRILSERAGAQFVSVLDRVCNQAGCLVALDGRPEGLMAFDDAHLTQAGSAFVVREVVCKNSSACENGSQRAR
jgi:peptidoglycan/LPS O-acetylase OafA/YrhL